MDSALTDLLSSLSVALAPGAAIVISLATLVLTQRRAEQTDARTAAKDTVEILAIQNTALLAEITNLHTRVAVIETERAALVNTLKNSEIEQHNLRAEVVKLTTLLTQATREIRQDVAGNKTLTVRATERADAAYEAANSLNEKIAEALQTSVNQTEAANERIARLEDVSPGQ